MKDDHDASEFGVSHYDLPTRDKIPIIRQLLTPDDTGLALDIGIGTGYATYSVFGDRPTVCVDIHTPNLDYYKQKLSTFSHTHQPHCVTAPATALPLPDEEFHLVLCSEVLEHLHEDDQAVKEIARVLAPDGKAIITVPYTGLGFTSFLELCGLRTVHDFPGPEQHVRRGYDEASLRALLARHQLYVEHYTYYLRFFTRVAVDLVSVCHLLYQRLVHKRRAWTWSEAASAEGGFAFRLYTWIFPLLMAFSRLDKLLIKRRGFGLIAVVRKLNVDHEKQRPLAPIA